MLEFDPQQDSYNSLVLLFYFFHSYMAIQTYINIHIALLQLVTIIVYLFIYLYMIKLNEIIILYEQFLHIIKRVTKKKRQQKDNKSIYLRFVCF